MEIAPSFPLSTSRPLQGFQGQKQRASHEGGGDSSAQQRQKVKPPCEEARDLGRQPTSRAFSTSCSACATYYGEGELGKYDVRRELGQVRPYNKSPMDPMTVAALGLLLPLFCRFLFSQFPSLPIPLVCFNTSFAHPGSLGNRVCRNRPDSLFPAGPSLPGSTQAFSGFLPISAPPKLLPSINKKQGKARIAVRCGRRVVGPALLSAWSPSNQPRAMCCDRRTKQLSGSLSSAPSTSVYLEHAAHRLG
ncbi:hypothetical protein N658DRAFT_148819 [Parathielavia hyrcaniae]|uniref:Uncharacterized protein n=1 Tax=Parathielavia hyrcaniae TaxID=113614 RepID=A0AAN6Q1C7_9PEZI|nr:hypothetical protein N658DRAFT_148819 [Parathielavia hyrcaniae]